MIEISLKNELVLWAESPGEADVFLDRMKRTGILLPIDLIFVAKRNGTARGNKYIEGQYYSTNNSIDDLEVYTDIVLAPQTVIDMVQWCTCDTMVTQGSTPLWVLEDTTHIVRMNLFQRTPRLAKAASLGVPAIMFQGTRGLDFSKRGDKWALSRYMKTYKNINVVEDGECLCIYYLEDGKDELIKERKLFELLKSIYDKNLTNTKTYSAAIMKEMDFVLGKNFLEEAPPEIPSIVQEEDRVVVKIGAKPDVKSWRTKGSGQMDTYIGMILAAKYNYCYDEQGSQCKKLVVEFTHLPKGFFWFENLATTTSMYKKLPFEFADEVVFLG